MTNDLKEFLQESRIINYKLLDGSYIIAQEVEFDSDKEYLAIINPVEIKTVDKKVAFTTWIDCEIDAVMRIEFRQIITSTEASLDYKSEYFKFFIYNKLRSILNQEEINQYLDETPNYNPSFDNLDLSEGFNYPNYFKDRMNWKWNN